MAFEFAQIAPLLGSSRPPPEDQEPDYSGFERQDGGVSGITSSSLVALAGHQAGLIGTATRPENVPWVVLGAMGWDPVIRIGERAACAPLQDPEIYYVRHPDPVVVAETEAWLRELLPDLIPILCRSFAYGVAPYVFNWEASDLTFRAEGKRNTRRSSGHQHYKSVHELWPGEVTIMHENDVLLGLHYRGVEYGADRAFVSVHERQYGGWLGVGSRRLAHAPWFKAAVTELEQARWLERGVVPLRIGRAPAGKIKREGKPGIPATRILNNAMMALRNGGAATLPAAFDGANALWDIKLIEPSTAPADVWHRTLNRFDALKLLSSLVPPAAVGAGGEFDASSHAAARVPAEIFVEFLQASATYIARQIQRVVRAVHRVNRPGRQAPEVLANQLPKSKRKTLLEVYKLVANVARQTEGGRQFTLAELVDPEIASQLGIPTTNPEDLPGGPTPPVPPAPAGRPRDATSDRETRREDARTDAGEEAVGAPGEGDG